MIKGVLFDFWGTLVENGTYSPLRQTYKILDIRKPFGEFAEKFEQVFMTKVFDDQATAFSEVCKAFNIDVKQPVIDTLIGIWNKNRLLAEPYPDTVDTLKALKDKGVKIVLVSNAPDNNIEPLLERFGITEFFDHVVVSYEHGKLKTTGLFELALKKLRLKKDEVLSVGDSIDTDIVGAKKVGIKAVLIDRKDRRDYELKIKGLKEIMPMLEG